MFLPKTRKKHWRGAERPSPRHWQMITVCIALFLVSLNAQRILQLIGQPELETIAKAKHTSREAEPRNHRRTKVQDLSMFWSLVFEWSQFTNSTLGRLMLSNGYGLFARMTTTRFELIVEGSYDGHVWQTIDFKYKPNTTMDLRFAGLHMPRLDWQMWFAALYPHCSRKWFFGFLDSILSGSQTVSDLVSHNPFHTRPPTYLRVQRVSATFTDVRGRDKVPAYWRFEDTREPYCPMLDLDALTRSNLQRKR